MERQLLVNARFIDRPVTGVERVAREALAAMARDHLDAQGGWTSPGGDYWRVSLVAPRVADTPSPWPNLPLLRHGRLRGHAWEQFELPRLVGRHWLLSPCNTGPLLKRRHLLFLHDAQPFAFPGNFTWSFRTWYRLLFHIAGRRAAGLLCNSVFTRDELVRRVGLDAHKITTCLLGGDHALRGTEVATLPPLPDTFLLAVSSPSPNKNFSAVVAALEILGDAAPACVIVGAPNERIFAQAQLDSKRIVRLGYVSDAQLFALYSRALALVYPSFYEGFGLPPLEAMTRGCPVVLARSSALPEIGGDAAEYCDPADPASVAEAIARVCTSPHHRNVLRERGHARASELTWSHTARSMLDALARTAGGSPHTDP